MNKKVAEVLFHENDKPYYFNSEITDLKRGEVVIVETIGGLVRASFQKYVSINKFEEGSPKRWILCRDRALTGNIKDYCLKSKIVKIIDDLT